MDATELVEGGEAERFTGCPASLQIHHLVTALAKAQGEFGPIEKDKTAKITSPKGNYSYDYADLATILSVVRPVLSKHGLAVFQPVTTQNGTVTIKTVLAHSSGQWIADDISFKAGDGEPRFVAGLITYGRRYGLITMIGVAPADEDDDAEAVAAPSRASATVVPQGFQEWLDDMRSAADEGEGVLKAAWAKSRPDYRRHLTQHDPTTWATLKTKADAVTQKAKADASVGVVE